MLSKEKQQVVQNLTLTAGLLIMLGVVVMRLLGRVGHAQHHAVVLAQVKSKLRPGMKIPVAHFHLAQEQVA